MFANRVIRTDRKSSSFKVDYTFSRMVGSGALLSSLKVTKDLPEEFREATGSNGAIVVTSSVLAYVEGLGGMDQFEEVKRGWLWAASGMLEIVEKY
jgi:hypothetical protein